MNINQSSLNDLMALKKEVDGALLAVQVLEAQGGQVDIQLYESAAADLNNSTVSGMAYFDKRTASQVLNVPDTSIPAWLGFTAGYAGRLKQMFGPYNSNRMFMRYQLDATWSSTIELLSTGNTIVDANGFIKTA
jgi:hypothetical protein